MPSLLAPLCVLTFLSLLISYHLHSCTLATLKWNICVRKALLLLLLLILLACLGQSMLTALMTLLGSILLGATHMSWATIFLKAPGRWVLLHFCSFSFLFLHLNTCSYNLSFKIYPTVQKCEELVWLGENTLGSCMEAGMMRMMMVVVVAMVGRFRVDFESSTKQRRFRWSCRQTNRHRHKHSLA